MLSPKPTLQFINKTEPLARTDFPCAACGKLILQGERHARFVYNERSGSHNSFYSDRFHIECQPGRKQ